MFKKILIANRGEIACRIIKTAKKLGLKTVAIYSEVDKNALHVQMADEAYYVGTAASKDSYLQSEKIIKIAQQAEAQAIHPGYGFLAETALFAEQCRKANIAFIGPPPAAIQAMGSKSTAKIIMEKANIPLLPGFHGKEQDADFLLKQACTVGFPIMLKAVAGGGGKGMRIVNQEDEFFDALQSAKREAKNSFDNDEMLIEKYVEKPRHIEMQIFADTHGNFVHLFERDCSIQRRHQKIIEEAPASNISEKTRERMACIAINAAKAINYVGAGTIEFLMDQQQNFYFMEMNTRLQVEHPVTEMITGLDLVEWQIRIAQGEVLPLTQQQITQQGCAIEVRIYAEDPLNNFLPATGKIAFLHTPHIDTTTRIDSGVTLDSEITPYYDPMLAKLIVWEETRDLAILKLAQALANYYIVGVKTNIDFLQKIIEVHSFAKGNITTNFIPEHEKTLLERSATIQDDFLISACLYKLLTRKKLTSVVDPYSPWQVNDGWRMNLISQQEFIFIFHKQEIKCQASFLNNYYKIIINDNSYLCRGTLEQQTLKVQLENRQFNLKIIKEQAELHLFYDGQHCVLLFHDPLHAYEYDTDNKHSMNAPMPGTVIAIFAKPGVSVKRGEKVMILEAMKMEHTIQAPSEGIIKAIHYSVGDIVSEGAELVSFESEE